MSNYLKNNPDRGAQPGVAARARWDKGDFAVVSEQEDARAFVAALKETHVSRPSRFLANMLRRFYRFRGSLPTIKQLAAVNKNREQRGLPVFSCRCRETAETKAEKKRRHSVAVEARHQAIVSSRPLKPPGKQ